MYSGGLNLSFLNGSNSLNQFNPSQSIQTNTVQKTSNTFEKVFEKSISNKVRYEVKNKKLNSEKTNPLKETSNDTSIKRPEPVKMENEEKIDVDQVQEVSDEVENVLQEVKEAIDSTDLKKVKALLQGLSEELGIEIPVEELMQMIETESLVPLNDLLEFIDFMFDGDLEQVDGMMLEKLEVELKELIHEMLDTVQQNETLTETEQAAFESQLKSLLSEMENVKPEIVKEIVKEVEVKTENVESLKEDSSAKGILDKLSVDDKATVDQKNETPFEAEVKAVKTTKVKSDGDSSEKESKGLKLGQTERSVGQELKVQVSETGQRPIEIFKDQNTLVSTVKTAQTATVTPKNIFDQVLVATNKMNFNVTENGSEMLVKLKPQELGQVELKVSIEKGVLMAEMTVENETVKAALESNMADLKNALSQKGYDVEGLNVSVGHQDKQESNEQHTGNQSRRIFGTENLDEELFDSHLEVTEVSDSRINYLG